MYMMFNVVYAYVDIFVGNFKIYFPDKLILNVLMMVKFYLQFVHHLINYLYRLYMRFSGIHNTYVYGLTEFEMYTQLETGQLYVCML